MVLNYETRESTMDIDCFRLEKKIEYEAARIASELNLEYDWLNDNVCVTKSYTEELTKYRKLYRVIGNLSVYTIKDLPLLCMKLVSFRPHTSDYDDCKNLIAILRKKYTVNEVRGMVYEIYKDSSVMSVDAELFLSKEYESDSFLLDDESLDSYCEMIETNLLSLDSVPTEFRSQVEERMKKTKPNNVLNAIDRLYNI